MAKLAFAQNINSLTGMARATGKGWCITVVTSITACTTRITFFAPH